MGAIGRRDVLRVGLAGAVCAALPEPVPAARSVIVLRMDGGPSQFDTWAPSDAGPSRLRSTSASGVWFAEGMPRLAEWAHRFAILADVVTPEINHRRARHLVRFGEPAPPTVIPALPYAVAVPRSAVDARYGSTAFARQCHAAFQTIRDGCAYAEAVLPGWDTHTDNALRVERLLADMDPAMAALMADLQSSGLLRSTLVVWMGEFGRTHAVNHAGGRDHDPTRTCVVVAGAGVRGGTMRRGVPTPLADAFATLAALGPVFGPRTPRFALGGRPIAGMMASGKPALV
jgi:uncharacterized protein (DUF1501 family)